MLPRNLWLLCLTAIYARTETTSTSTSTSPTSNQFYTNTFSTLSNPSTNAFTGSDYTYETISGQKTVVVSGSRTVITITDAQITASVSQTSLTRLSGFTNATSSSTTSAAAASNTIPCNGYPEFCNRKYSNITHVCAHNSAFAIKNNAGSNQALPIENQLNDGIRMIQGETQYVNDTIMNCHTSCDLLNAGTFQAELESVANWLRQNPYDVVTWLIVNSDFVSVDKYVAPIQNSGIAQYLYQPSYIPQRLDQWPTLGEMIITGKRLVMFMDYNANQSMVPWILDEFTHMWETPFSPTDQNFPCDVQRPPKLSDDDAKDQFLYLANHNLNTAVDLSALTGGGSKGQILIPNTAEINQTNGAANKFGQLGAMAQNCTKQWDRPPNFLLVDYYNYGDPEPGSVFEVAARANGVTYNYGHCCGMNRSAAPVVRCASTGLVAALAFILVWIF